MPGRRRALAAVLVAAIALAGCSRGGADDQLMLDGSPRRPDAEGVVEEISAERIVLDGDREYSVSASLQSFSTYDLAASPMLSRRGQYVQVGLDGDEVEWMAGIGVVVRTPERDPVVFYNGHLLRIDGGEAVFRDGTVLRLAEGVRAPEPAGPVRAEIDPAAHTVRALVNQ